MGLGRSLALAAALATAAAPTSLLAQTTRDVRGAVADSAGAPVDGAMVVALALPDSVLTRFALTEGDGAFELSRVPVGDYVLQVTMAGFQTLRQDFAVPSADGFVDLGTVALTTLAVEMEPLVVSVEHVPFINRGDTLAFNALAFPVPPNAQVEDLLKRLPGLQVDPDGTITALGVEVQNVLVDGKEFFGSDPTIATRSLPADAVERVQVYDKESDLAEFTGVPDGNEERTIDLELKEEAKRGHFGRVASSLGADGGATLDLASPGQEGMRYDETFTVNRFSPSTQLALLGNVNNINQAGFSWTAQAASPTGADGGRSGTRDDGHTTSRALGFNGSYDFGQEPGQARWIRGSYFLSSLDNVQDQTVQQQQLLGSRVGSASDQTNHDASDLLSHRLNLNVQYALGEGHDLRLRTDLNQASMSATHTGHQETHTADGDLINTASTDRASDNDVLSGGATLTWRKRLGQAGRTLVAELTANVSDPDQSTDLSTITGTPTDDTPADEHDGAAGDVLSFDEVLQEQSQEGRTLSHSQRLSLTQRLGRLNALEIFGQRKAVDEDQVKEVWDLGQEGGPRELNEELSARFDRTYTYLQGGMRLSRNTETKLLTAGLTVQSSDLDGTLVDEGQRITNGYTNVLPNVRFRYQPRPGRSLDLRYATSTREPSLTQLQPFADNTDPLRVYSGNPDLEPQYSHTVSASYRSFDQFDFTNLYVSGRFGWTRDDIVESRNVDERGVQEIMPVNLDGSWSASASTSYDTPIRPLGIETTVSYSVSYARSRELLNEAENESRRWSHTANVRVENRAKDVFDLSAGARLGWSDVSYSLSDRLDQSYLNSTLYANATWYYGADWTLTSTFNLRLYDEDVFGPGRDVGLLNATVSRYVADKRGEIQITGFDLLGQNQGVSFSNTASVIRESRVQSLGRHVMVRLLWRLGMAPGGR